MLKLIRKGKTLCEAFQGGVHLKGIGTSIVYVSVCLPTYPLIYAAIHPQELQKAFWNTLHQLVGGMPHVIPSGKKYPLTSCSFLQPRFGKYGINFL